MTASCPVPQEQRGLGAIDNDPAADEAARRWVVIKALDKQLRAALKSYHEQPPHYCPKVNDSLVVRWRPKPDGRGRDFGVFAPADARDGHGRTTMADADYLDQWTAELARQQEKEAA